MISLRLTAVAALCALSLAGKPTFAQSAASAPMGGTSMGTSMPMGASAPMAGAASMSKGMIATTDKMFVKDAAIGGMTEVELGKQAASKGTAQGVKDFGSKMVDDHTKAGDELKQVATTQGITPPNKPDTTHQRVIDKFAKMPAGAAWDKAYLAQMVTDHKKTIALFQKQSKSGKNTDLKAFADKTLPTLKSHLDMLTSMKM